MLLFYIRKIKGKIKTQLIYKPSEEAGFRLSKALSMLLTEKDIIDYLQSQQNNKIPKSKRSILIRRAISRKTT